MASTPMNSEPDSESLDQGDDQGVRLQKVLAAAGLGSRRTCEQLIAAGRVSVNGQVVEQMGTRVDPATAVIAVDGARVNVRSDLVYLALNKPRGVLSAMSDDRGRPTVGDLVADRPERLFHVGRLDGDSEGLLLLTNDGELAHRLMHPAFGVAKTYLATVPGPVPKAVARRLRSGVELEDGPVQVDRFRVVQTQGERAIVEVVLHEGRNHIVRRLLAEVGHPVQRLVRTAIGPVQLGGQRAGSLRELTRAELAELHRLVDKQINIDSDE
jgi:23S rRNA pseudouridine2605 synthase